MVDFPVSGLDLAPYSTPGALCSGDVCGSGGGDEGGGSGGGSGGGGGRGADRWQSEQQSGVRDRLLRGTGGGHRSVAPLPTYELYAVCNHMGGLQGGHYTAHCRSRIGGGTVDEWHTFDDARVAPTNPVRVGGTSAYVLFFRLS